MYKVTIYTETDAELAKLELCDQEANDLAILIDTLKSELEEQHESAEASFDDRKEREEFLAYQQREIAVLKKVMGILVPGAENKIQATG